MTSAEKTFVKVDEVQKALGVGRTKAYAIMDSINKELESKGFLTFKGKIPRKAFEQKIFGYEECAAEKAV